MKTDKSLLSALKLYGDERMVEALYHPIAIIENKTTKRNLDIAFGKNFMAATNKMSHINWFYEKGYDIYNNALDKDNIKISEEEKKEIIDMIIKYRNDRKEFGY